MVRFAEMGIGGYPDHALKTKNPRDVRRGFDHSFIRTKRGELFLDNASSDFGSFGDAEGKLFAFGLRGMVISSPVAKRPLRAGRAGVSFRTSLPMPGRLAPSLALRIKVLLNSSRISPTAFLVIPS